MLNTKTFLYALCLLELSLNVIRISFYVVDIAIPITFFGLGLTRMIFFISAAILIFVIFTVKQIPKYESIFIVYFIFVFLVSSFINPMRDAFFEVQGWLQFLISLSIIRLSLKFNSDLSYCLLRYLIVVTGLFIWLFLISFINAWITFDFVEDGSLRLEGILSSSVVLGLMLASLASITYGVRSRGVFLIGFSAALLLALLSVTRSVIALAFFLSLIFALSIIFRKTSWTTKLIGTFAGVLFVALIWMLINIFLSENLEFVIYRFNAEGSSASYRISEIIKELALFGELPIFGHGVGLRYVHNFGVKDAFYGHNLYTSALARYGVFGMFVFMGMGLYIIKLLRNKSLDTKLNFFVKITFLAVLAQLAVANFSYHLTLGFYGALIGILHQINGSASYLSISQKSADGEKLINSKALINGGG